MPGAGVLIVVIENYIHTDMKDAVWYDRCLVQLIYRGGTVVDTAMTTVEVPEQFEPRHDPDIPAPMLGYKQTCGERVHAIDPNVPNGDWYQSVSSTNPSRAAVIVDALHRAVQQLVLARSVRTQFVQYRDFPKPGVLFEDMFAAFARPRGASSVVQTLVNQVNAHLGPVTLEQHDSLGAPGHHAAHNWRDTFFVVGLESRGLMLGAMLATRLGTPFVPIRKPGKLPGSLLQETFEKEYGTDSCEMQTEYMAQLPQRCIIVDDVLATGGSMNAACALMQAAGKQIALIVALVDVPPLRKQWQSALAPFKAPVALSLI